MFVFWFLIALFILGISVDALGLYENIIWLRRKKLHSKINFLDSVLAARAKFDSSSFPIVVSQDCGHTATLDVIKKYASKNPDLSVQGSTFLSISRILDIFAIEHIFLNWSLESAPYFSYIRSVRIYSRKLDIDQNVDPWSELHWTAWSLRTVASKTQFSWLLQTKPTL